MEVRACANRSMSSVSADNSPSPPAGITGWFIGWVSDWGDLVLRGIMAIGDFSLFVLRTFVWMFTRLPRSETVWPNFYQVGVSSLPVVALTGTFIGMVLAVQSNYQFRQFRSRNTAGWRDQHDTRS